MFGSESVVLYIVWFADDIYNLHASFVLAEAKALAHVDSPVFATKRCLLHH